MQADDYKFSIILYPIRVTSIYYANNKKYRFSDRKIIYQWKTLSVKENYTPVDLSNYIYIFFKEVLLPVTPGVSQIHTAHFRKTTSLIKL